MALINFSPDDEEDLVDQMHEAIQALDERKVRELLAAGVPADVWGFAEDGDLPLQVVARLDGEAAVAIAQALIESGADIDSQGDYDCTALARAVVAQAGSNRDDWAMARFLVKAGANPSLADRDGMCPAESALSNGNESAVLAMLDAGMSPNARGLLGSLLWYCAWNDPAMVRELLARGAHPDAAASLWGGSTPQTPLQRAVESLDAGGDEEAFVAIAIALIEAGADPRLIDPAPKCLEAFLLAREERAAFSDLPTGKDGRGPLPPL